MLKKVTIAAVVTAAALVGAAGAAYAADSEEGPVSVQQDQNKVADSTSTLSDLPVVGESAPELPTGSTPELPTGGLN